jgi:hypothetical protein
MPEEKKHAPQPVRAEPKAEPALAPASESGDPAVHQILAELDISRRNEDDEQVKTLTERLAKLGFK